MTLTLNLPPELEQYLLQEANQQGLSIEAVTLQLFTHSILQVDWLPNFTEATTHGNIAQAIAQSLHN